MLYGNSRLAGFPTPSPGCVDSASGRESLFARVFGLVLSLERTPPDFENIREDRYAVPYSNSRPVGLLTLSPPLLHRVSGRESSVVEVYRRVVSLERTPLDIGRMTGTISLTIWYDLRPPLTVIPGECGRLLDHTAQSSAWRKLHRSLTERQCPRAPQNTISMAI